jgi:hypothetical protein
MDARDEINPIDYAQPPQPPDWPQSECGGVASVMGMVTVVLALCVALLHAAFTAGDSMAARRLLAWEAGIVGVMALVGVILAVCGLLQRARRRGAAVFGLVLNALILTIAGVVWLWA